MGCEHLWHKSGAETVNMECRESRKARPEPWRGKKGFCTGEGALRKAGGQQGRETAGRWVAESE